MKNYLSRLKQSAFGNRLFFNIISSQPSPIGSDSRYGAKYSLSLLGKGLGIGVLLYITLSCSKLGDVAVSARNFEDEIATAQNLVFTFNKDLVNETDLDNWEAVEYVRIEPKVEGVFKWSAKNELIFSPANGFKPATNYKATITKEVLRKAATKKYDLDAESFDFHTSYLKPEKIESYWMKGADGKPTSKLKIDFNYAVNETEVDKLLKVNIGEEEAKFYVNNTPNDEKLLLTLNNAPSSKEETTLKATIEKGVKVSGSGSSTQQAYELEGVLPSPYVVKIIDVVEGFEKNQGIIKVTTTQQIVQESIKEAFSIEPAVETTIEPIENGFIIKGFFNPSEAYTLKIKDNLRGTLGAKLDAEFSKDLFFGEMPSIVEFTSKKGLYLSSKGSRNVGIRLINIPKVQLKITKVYENNILHFLKTNRYEDYNSYNEETEQYDGYNYGDDSQGIYGDVVVDRTIETGNLAKLRGVSLLNMPLPEQGKNRGVFLVNVNSNDEYYHNANKLVSVSDLGLIAKKSADGNEVLVFINSIIDAEAVGGVEVNLVSSNNQIIETQKTDGKGVVIFEKLKEKAPNFKVALITAKTEDDFNYMLLEDAEVETSRFEVDGKRANSTGFDAFIYGDRDIYRPGETIHFNTVVRDGKWVSAEGIPLKIRVLLPNGKEFKSFLKSTNDQGAIDTSVPLDRAAVTGTYTIEVLNGNDVLMSSKPISIEEFMPDRIKVEVSAKDAYRSGETISLNATATNLFGPPASNRNYEMDFSLKRKTFTAKGFEGYVFDIQNDTKFNNDLRQGITDANGQAKQDFQISDTYQGMGLLEGKIFVTVFDETGRPVNRMKRFDVFTQKTFYGIGLDDYYVGTHSPMTIPLAAVSTEGKPTSAQAEVEIYRIEYQTVVEKTDGVIRYNSKRLERLVESKNISFSAGKSAVKFIPQVSGEYEIRIHETNAKSYSSREFYAYGWGNTSSSAFEVSNEGEVLMEFDKEKYEVGDNAKILMKTPFAGKMLVTVERGTVIEHFYVETDKKSAEVSVKVTDEMIPNVYVTATLIRPMKNSDMPLTVAHGFAPMKVEKPSNLLPIEIVADKESRSKRKQKVRIKTKANTELTIAVVDEGILQLKNFKTPDIYNYFYQKRALEVSSHDLYPFLFPELSLASNSSVGGDGYDLEKRVNPLSNGRAKLVALWSGIIKTGFGGEAEFEFDIPQFSGDLRIMAVAYKDEAFGSANANMKVKDPIIISAGVPRFLSPNDEVLIPVMITNTTKNDTKITASVGLKGGLSLVGANNQSLTLPAGKEVRTTFSVKAPTSIGTGSIEVAVNGFKEKFVENVDLTIRPSTSLLKTAISGVVNGGQSGTINLANDFMAGSAKASVLISRSPMVQFAKELDYLLGYPHGCVEQTVSKAFPQLYFADFTKTIAKKSKSKTATGENDWNPQFNVQSAIRKIENMQLYNGALSYWQGGNTESWWGTAFAAHFLIEAKKADYEVNEAVLGKMLDYLTTKTSTQELTEQEFFYGETGGNVPRTIAKREMIYSLYTLALAERANQSVMNYYKSNLNLLTTDERYMLAACYNQIGDSGAFKALLPKDYIVENTAKQTGGSFASPIRNLAIALNCLIESDPENLQIPKLARVLSQAVKSNKYLSTQESVFSFLALGKIARKNAESNVTGSLLANNKYLSNFTGTDLFVEKGIAGSNLTLSAKGKGGLYYFAQQEGLSATGSYVEEDNFLRVRRQFLSRTGQPIGGSLKQNQLVVVKVTLSSTVPIENVVITDMLPAAFEIENPRLNEDRDMTWIKNASTPQHFDIRDDRINFYTNTNETEQSFYYLVRVVSRGKFILGPVSADAMYNGDYRSYNGGGNVIVE